MVYSAETRFVRKRAPASDSASKTKVTSPQAQAVGDPTFIYKDSNFDSEIIGTAVTGQVYSISTGIKNGFRKLRLKPGLVGFVSVDDIKVVTAENAKKIKNADEKKTENKKKSKKVRSIELTRYRGVVVQNTNYAEDSLGKVRTAPLLFFGAKISGYNTFFEGDVYTESNILLHWGAPNYYADATGRSADGWIVMTDFLVQSVFPQSQKHMLFFGFGPVFRYSHFNATLREGSKDVSYSLDEMTLGAALNAGIAYQISSYDLRLDAKYIWEKQKYFAVGLAFQLPF